MTDLIKNDAKDKMEKTLSFLQQELSGLRTGKANPALVENLSVDYYGTPTRLRDISNISNKEFPVTLRCFFFFEFFGEFEFFHAHIIIIVCVRRCIDVSCG